MGSSPRRDPMKALAHSLAAAAMSTAQENFSCPDTCGVSRLSCAPPATESGALLGAPSAVRQETTAAVATAGEAALGESTDACEACPQLPRYSDAHNAEGTAYPVEDASYVPKCLLPDQLDDHFLPLESPKRRQPEKDRPMRDDSKILSPAQKAHIGSGFYRIHRGQKAHLAGADRTQVPSVADTNSANASDPQAARAASVSGTSSSCMAPNPTVPSEGSQVMASALSHQASALVAGTTRKNEQQNLKAGPEWASERQQQRIANRCLQPGTALLLQQTCQVQGEHDSGTLPQADALPQVGVEGEAGRCNSPGTVTSSKPPENRSQQCDSGSDEEDGQKRSSAMKHYLARKKRASAPESGVGISIASQKRSRRQLANSQKHSVNPSATNIETEVLNRVKNAFEVLNASASDKAQEWPTGDTSDRLEQHSVSLRAAQPQHGAATLRRDGGGGASTAWPPGSTAASSRKQAQPANALRAGKAGKAGADAGSERLDFELQEDLGVWAENVADKAGTAAACAARAQIHAAFEDPKAVAGDAEVKGKVGGKHKRIQRQRRWSDGGDGKGIGRVRRKPALADLYTNGYGEEEPRDASSEPPASPGTNQGTQSESSPSPNQRGKEGSHQIPIDTTRHAGASAAIKPQYAAVEALAVAQALQELRVATSSAEQSQDPPDRANQDSNSRVSGGSKAQRGRPRDPRRNSTHMAANQASLHNSEDQKLLQISSHYQLAQCGSSKTALAKPKEGNTCNSLLSAAGVIKRHEAAPSGGGKGSVESSSGVGQTLHDLGTSSGCITRDADDVLCSSHASPCNPANYATEVSAKCGTDNDRQSDVDCEVSEHVADMHSEEERTADAIKFDASQPDSIVKGTVKSVSRLRTSLSEPCSDLRQLLRRLHLGNVASPDTALAPSYRLSRFQEISHALPPPIRSTLADAVAAAQLLSEGHEDLQGESGHPVVSVSASHVAPQPQIAPQFHASSPPRATAWRSPARLTMDSQDTGPLSPGRECSSALLVADSCTDLDASRRSTFIVVEGRSRSADTAAVSGDPSTGSAPGKHSDSNMISGASASPPGKRSIMMQVTRMAAAGDSVKALAAMPLPPGTTSQHSSDAAPHGPLEGTPNNSSTRSGKQAPVIARRATQHPHRSSKHAGALQPASAIGGGRLKVAAFGRRASRAPEQPRGPLQTAYSKYQLQGFGSGGAIQSETIGFAQKAATSPMAATIAATSDSDDFCHVLMGDTSAIWRSDADFKPAGAHKPSKHSVPSPNSTSSLGPPGGGSLWSQAAMNQTQLRELWNSANLQPSYLLPSTHSMLTDGPGPLTRSTVQLTQHAKRMGAMREHQLRERIQAATQHNANAPSGAEMHGMLTQQRNAVISEGTDRSTGGAVATHIPGALLSSISPSRLIVNTGDRGLKTSNSFLPLGPRTTELLEKVDNREFRAGWHS